MDKEILKAFLRSITGNDIMKTNNDDYTCVNEFMDSDKYKMIIESLNFDGWYGKGFEDGLAHRTLKCKCNKN